MAGRKYATRVSSRLTKAGAGAAGRHSVGGRSRRRKSWPQSVLYDEDEVGSICTDTESDTQEDVPLSTTRHPRHTRTHSAVQLTHKMTPWPSVHLSSDAESDGYTVMSSATRRRACVQQLTSDEDTGNSVDTGETGGAGPLCTSRDTEQSERALAHTQLLAELFCDSENHDCDVVANGDSHPRSVGC